MKTKICLLLVSALVFFCLSASWAEEILIFTSPSVINIPEGKVLCKPTEISASPEIQGVLAKYGTLSVKQAFAEDTVEFLADKEHVYLATLPEGVSAKDMVVELNALVDFSLDSLLKNATAADSLKPWLHATTNPIDVERGLPNDTLLSEQWGLTNYWKGIRAYNAWEITRGDPNVKIGIVDHGADINHPDLYPRVTGDIPQYTSHGTMVAGVVGPVTNNNRGVAGVDWYSQIRSFSDEPGGEQNFSSTLMRARNAGMNIINVSISTGDVTEEDLWLMHSAVAKLYNAGVFIAAAMGNDGVPETGAPSALWPWAVCAVGASNYNGSRVAWSNKGWPLDLMAPGGTSTGGGPYDIKTTAIVFPADTIPPGNDTLPPKVVVPQGNWIQTYKFVSGCSFAAPYVAGSASLLKAKNPVLNNDDLHNILTMSARDMDVTGRDDLTGYGLVNIDSALKLISPPHAFVQGVTTSAPYVVSTSDWGKSMLYDVDDLPPGVYFMRVREVRQVVYFPHPFLSTPIVWARGSQTDGYLPDNVTYGIKCAWVTQVFTDRIELATYNLEVVTLDGDHTYFLPKAVNDVRLACSALGEMDLYAVNPATEVIRQPQQNKINVNWVDYNYGEQGYKVQKQDSAGDWHDVGVAGENSQNIADSTVAGSERAVYRVKAYNQERESPFSSPVEARNAPNAPSEVQLSVTKRPRIWDMTGEPTSGGNGGTAGTAGQSVFISLGKKTPNPDPPSSLVSTNEVKITWSQPKNQKLPVTNYQAFARYYMYSGIPGFGGWVYMLSPLLPPDSFSYTFYPLPRGNDPLLRGQVEITVYSIVNNGASVDTSYKNTFYVTPGNYDAHPQPPSMCEKPTAAIPTVFSLSQNYPNPFNATTIISYALPEGAEVRLDIYNVLGQKVRTLVNEYQEAGIKKVEWDGKNEDGQRVASGVYLYNIRAGSFHQTRKMGLLK